MMGATVEEWSVLEEKWFGHEFPLHATVSVSHAAPPSEGTIFPRKFEEPIESIEVVAWDKEGWGRSNALWTGNFGADI